MKKNLFLFLLLLGIWQQVHSQQFVSGDLVYEITSPTTVKLSSQDPSLAGNITIPASVDYNNQAYTVTVIDGYSFYGLLITSVVIPNTVTTIGYAAFSVCGSLTSVTIPNSVTEIGDYAFALTGLSSVICNATTPPNIYFDTFSGVNSSCSLTVPIASLTAYQAAPFWQNFNLIGDGILNTTTVTACSSYTWENTNQTYTATGVYTGTTTNGVTEQLDLTILSTNFSVDGINYVVTSPTTVEVGNNTGASGDIVIPATVTIACGTYSVTEIGSSAFRGCSSLTSVTIPNSVTEIGSSAFRGCSSLTSVTIPNSVTVIGSSAFRNCSSLTSIICNVTSPIDISSNVFQGVDLGNCSLTVPTGSVGAYQDAFVWENFDSISSNVVFNTTTVSACSSYTWENNNETYTVTGVYTGTTTNGVTEQLDLTILSNFSVDGINYVITSPNTVAVDTSGDATGAVVIPATVTSSCGTYGVTSINYAAFAGSSLTSVTIPNSVTSIGSAAFNGCTSLTSVTIGNSVTSIGGAAFAGCTGLTSVICNVTSPITINGSVFGGVNQSACSLAVPNGSVTAYQAAPVWQDFRFPNNNLSKIIDSQCGTTLSALNTLIRANAITGASHYKFKVVNGAITEIFEPTNGRKWFRLTSLPGGTFYNTAYTISVAVKKNNVWGEYGAECTVTTPAFPTTKVKDSQCGVTLASITTFISADAVNAASGYRFKVVNGASTEIIEAVSGSRWFRLTSLSGGASYNTTYTIRAASRYNGVWSDYGNECTVTTPAAPLSKLIDRQCGMTLASGNATLLYATSVSVAQKYRFEVSLGADVYTYDTASSSVRSFRMTEVPSLTLVSGTTYGVRVAIMVNDAWQPYGESCNVTTFGAAPNFVKSMNVDTTNFNVITYPNPFTENFNLNLTSLSEEKVTVMVYDMTGKLLESKEVVPSELRELQIGNNFASGVYNVIVSQGENTKSIRVIKK